MCSLENSSEWCPPPKFYGGENISEYFAMLLTEETVSMMVVENWRGKNRGDIQINIETIIQGLPICSKIQSLVSTHNEVSIRLKEKDLYFYPNQGGSIFMDYKIMRNNYFEKKGKEINLESNENASGIGYKSITDKFKMSMSTEEALELSKNIVNEWAWGESSIEDNEIAREIG